MWKDDWLDLTPAEAGDIVASYNRLEETPPLDPAYVDVEAKDLSFYVSGRLLKLTNSATLPTTQQYLLDHPGGRIRLRGTLSQLATLNAGCGLHLTAENVADYLRYVLSLFDPFGRRSILVESVDQVRPVSEADEERLGGEIHPVSLSRTTSTGAFHLSAVAEQQRVLSDLSVEVRQDGTLHLLEEHPVLSDLPTAVPRLR